MLGWVVGGLVAGIIGGDAITDLTELAEASSDPTGAEVWAAFGTSGVLMAVLGAVSGICGLAWIVLLGRNAGTYGMGGLIGLAASCILVVLVTLLAPALGLLALFALVAWPLRRFVEGLWGCGGFSPTAALLGWLPLLVGLAMIGGATALSADDAEVGVVLAIAWLGGLGLVMLSVGSAALAMLVVTIIQHTGIAEDRRRQVAWHAAAG